MQWFRYYDDMIDLESVSNIEVDHYEGEGESILFHISGDKCIRWQFPPGKITDMVFDELSKRLQAYDMTQFVDSCPDEE